MSIIPPGETYDWRPELIPAPLLQLFGDDFVRSGSLIEEYVFRLAVDVFRRLGGESATASPATCVEIVERCGLSEQCARVPVDWLARLLCQQGVLTQDPGGPEIRYRLDSPLPVLDPAEVRGQQEAHDPRCLPSFDIAAVAAEAYPACLRGELRGEHVLFAPTRLALWSRYFHNSNPLYAVNNRLTALDAVAGGSFATVLELGGGLGSAALALLGVLADAGRLENLERYRFTDISPVFLRQGEKVLRGRYDDDTLELGRLDIDRDFADQKVPPASFDLVFAVNTVHVARDLEFTLRQILKTLRPGGRLVFGEGIRPFPLQPVYTELVFLLLESFRNPILHPDWRPTGSFLTPEQWIAALEHAGFVDIKLLPDVTKIREYYTSFVVASLSARRPAED